MWFLTTFALILLYFDRVDTLILLPFIFVILPSYTMILGAMVVRSNDRCVLAQSFADREAQDIWGDLVSRCTTHNNRTSFYTQLPSSPRKVGVHVMTDDTTGYAIVSDHTVSRRDGHQIVDECSKQFKKMFPEGVASLAPKTTGSFVQQLEQIISKYSTPGAMEDKVLKVKNAVNEVKTLALDNVEKVLERGSKIDDIVVQTDELQNSAAGFQSSARSLRSAMWWNNFKIHLAIAAGIALFILVLYLFVCGGSSCSSKKEE